MTPLKLHLCRSFSWSFTPAGPCCWSTRRSSSCTCWIRSFSPRFFFSDRHMICPSSTLLTAFLISLISVTCLLFPSFLDFIRELFLHTKFVPSGRLPYFLTLFLSLKKVNFATIERGFLSFFLFSSLKSMHSFYCDTSYSHIFQQKLFKNLFSSLVSLSVSSMFVNSKLFPCFLIS